MPAKKSTSPEEAQRKLWILEYKDFTKARRKIARDTARETKALRAEIRQKERRLAAVLRSSLRHTATIDRRLGILNGRIG
jgi:hypothetical protein